MRERTSVTNSIENINSINRYDENLSILNSIDEGSFSKLVKLFGNEKDQNKVLLSGYLNSTDKSLGELRLGEMEIDISHIKNYIWNKPDIPKDLEKKIAKLYLKNLYDTCTSDNSLILQLNSAFDINIHIDEEYVERASLEKIKSIIDEKNDIDFGTKSHLSSLCDRGIIDELLESQLKSVGINTADIVEGVRNTEKANLEKIKKTIDNKKNIDFKTIKVYIDKLGDGFNDKINSVVVSNDEIFSLLKNDINKLINFKSHRPSSQTEILDILQFEMKGMIDYAKTRKEKAEKDMEEVASPLSTISKAFDRVRAKDSRISKLMTKKGKIEELANLVSSNDIYNDKTVFTDYVAQCEKAKIDSEYIGKLKGLLSRTTDKRKLKEFCVNETESINKEIWEKYIENFEKEVNNGELMDKKFIEALKKLVRTNFNFSLLDKQEQTALRQTLIVDNIDILGNELVKCADLDQNEFKKFMQDICDFEKGDMTLSVLGRGELNLKIKKEVNESQIKGFSDVEHFKSMDITQPIKFTVNIDGSDKEIIEDLESEGDNILRVSGMMETHDTMSGPINIGNGYILELCGKKITKPQLDELLLCKDLPELNKCLEDFGLFEELKDEVYNTRKELNPPQNVYSNLDEDGFDMAPSENSGEISLSDKHCIFEEVLKKLDVKIIERNLIFEGRDIDKLSQIYIMSKLGGLPENKKLKENQDAQANTFLDAARELGNAESGKANATALWDSLKDDFNQNSLIDDDGEIQYQRDNAINDEAQEYRNQLSSEGKTAFKDKLIDLCNNDPDLGDEEKDVLGDSIDDLIDELDSFRNEQNVDNNAPKTSAEHEKTQEEKRREAWDALSGDQEVGAKKNKEDENEKREIPLGTRLYFDLGESQLPPLNNNTGAGSSLYCFEIVDISDTTFTLKAIGGELKSELIGKEFILPKTQEQLESMKKGGSIYKVRARTSNKWDDCLESINKAGFFKEFTSFGKIGTQVHMDGDKLVNKEGEEIKYFTNVDFGFDDSNEDKSLWGQGVKFCKYEIKKINTSKGTIKLATSFDGYDKNYNDVKYGYENEITFEQFILLMEGKKLKGCTEDKVKELETKYEISDPKRLPTKGMRKRVSIGTIVGVLKNSTKSIKTKMDDRKKQQDEDFENYLFSQEGLNLYGKLGGLFGNTSLGDAAKKLQYEFYTNRENRTRKRIEERYKIFESDPIYPEFFGEHLYPILKREGDVRNDKDRYKFAAAFLFMVKNEGPYPRQFADKKDKGKRVENILGPEHKKRFLNFYEKKKNELDQEKDMGHQSGVRLALQEELNKMEIQYIISTIDGRAPYGGAGSNDMMLKSIWSKKFMSQLEDNIKGYYNEHESEKGKLDSFYSSEEAYLRNIGSGKFQKALPALERMCETAKTPSEVFRIKGYLLGAMLMGIIKNNASVKTIKSFWGTCRAIGFTPGYRMRDIQQQDKIKALLDGITNNEFSNNKTLNYKVSDFEPGNIKDGKYGFGKLFQSYRNSHGLDILKKIENPPYKKDDNDKSIIDLANEKDNPHKNIFKDIIKNSTTNEIDSMNKDAPPIFAQESPLSATSNMVMNYIPSSGSYKPNNPEEISTIEEFWKNAKNCIPSGASDKETTGFLFKKYFNRFNRSLSPNDKQMIVKSLPLIKKEKGQHEKEAYFMLWYMMKGILHSNTSGSFPEDFENVINKFVNFFFENIQYIDQSLIKETFTDKEVYSLYEKPYRMLNWSSYLEYNMKDTKGMYSSYKSNYNNSMNYYLNQQNISEEDVINEKIEHIWRSIHNKCTVPDKSGIIAGEDFPIMNNQQLRKIKEQAQANTAEDE